MSDKVVWLFVFFALYGAYCIFWGVASARGARTASDFFLADRQIPAWVFVAAATATSLTGWVALGLPTMIFRGGFSAAPLTLCAISIPLAGVLFLKRQWMLSRQFGYVTPAEMFSDYFGGRLIRLIVMAIALAFALPFLGLQLAAAGYLVEIVSDGATPWVYATWILAALAFLYVCLGGMRAAAYVGVLQALFLAAAIVGIGVVALAEFGGFAKFVSLLAKLGASKIGPWGASTAGYNAYFATPGVIQFTAGLGREAPAGGVFTASMVLSYGLALMGLQMAPAFTIGAFATRDAKGFAPQQVWATAAVAGATLGFFAVIGGVGAVLLGASATMSKIGVAADILPHLDGGREIGLVAYYFNVIGARAPWFAGLLGVAAVAATQATAALYAAATGAMFARDFYRHFLNPEADERQQKLFGRVGVGLTLLGALLLATYAPRAEAESAPWPWGSGFSFCPRRRRSAGCLGLRGAPPFQD